MKDRITNSFIDSYYLFAGRETMYCVGLRDGRYRLSERVRAYFHFDALLAYYLLTTDFAKAAAADRSSASGLPL